MTCSPLTSALVPQARILPAGYYGRGYTPAVCQTPDSVKPGLMHTPEENPCLCPESRRLPPQYIAALQDGFGGVARQAHRRDRRAGETGRPARQARRRDGRAVAGARPASSRIAGLAAQGACHGDLWRNSERGRRALGRRGLTMDTGAVSILLCHRLLMSLALSPPHAEHRSPG